MTGRRFWSFRTVLSAIALLFLTFVIVTFISRLIYVHNASYIDDSIWEDEYADQKVKDRYKIVVLMSKNSHYSLRTTAKRLHETAIKIGWESYLLEDYKPNIVSIKNINPDFVISLIVDQDLDGEKTSHNIYAYLLLSSKKYFGGIFSFKPEFRENKYPHLDKIDGFLCGFKNIVFLKDYLESKGKKFYGFRSFAYVPKTSFQNIKQDKLLYYGTNLDKFRSSNKFKMIFTNLHNSNLLSVYGPYDIWGYLGSSMKGEIKEDNNAILNMIRRYGISLIIHSRMQNLDGIPSSRIFESIASSAIVISDKNSFVEKNFGNSILYINVERPANKIYHEILDHIVWVKNNPSKAKEKSKNAHKILSSKFTTEIELIKIAKMHERIMKDRADNSRKSNF